MVNTVRHSGVDLISETVRRAVRVSKDFDEPIEVVVEDADEKDVLDREFMHLSSHSKTDNIWDTTYYGPSEAWTVTVRLAWSDTSKTDAEAIDEELVRLVRLHGLERVDFGLQSLKFLLSK